MQTRLRCDVAFFTHFPCSAVRETVKGFSNVRKHNDRPNIGHHHDDLISSASCVVVNRFKGMREKEAAQRTAWEQAVLKNAKASFGMDLLNADMQKNAPMRQVREVRRIGDFEAALARLNMPDARRGSLLSSEAGRTGAMLREVFAKAAPTADFDRTKVYLVAGLHGDKNALKKIEIVECCKLVDKGPLSKSKIKQVFGLSDSVETKFSKESACYRLTTIYLNKR